MNENDKINKLGIKTMLEEAAAERQARIIIIPLAHQITENSKDYHYVENK